MSTFTSPVIEEGATTDPTTPQFGFRLFGYLIRYFFLSTEGYFEEFIYDYSSDETINYELDGVPHHCLESTLDFNFTALNESTVSDHQVPWYLGSNPMLWSMKTVLDKSYIGSFVLNIFTTWLTEYISALIWLYIIISTSIHLYLWFDNWFYRYKTLPYAAKNLHLSKWVFKKHGFVVFPLHAHEVIEDMKDDINYGPLPPPYPVVSGYEITDGKYVRVLPQEAAATATATAPTEPPDQKPVESVEVLLPTAGEGGRDVRDHRPAMELSTSGFYGSVIRQVEGDDELRSPPAPDPTNPTPTTAANNVEYTEPTHLRRVSSGTPK